MQTDLRIRMHIRFPGDPPADLSGFSDPVTIQGVVIGHGGRAGQQEDAATAFARPQPKETAHD